MIHHRKYVSNNLKEIWKLTIPFCILIKIKKNQSQLTVYDNVKILTSQVQIELELLELFCYEI